MSNTTKQVCWYIKRSIKFNWYEFWFWMLKSISFYLFFMNRSYNICRSYFPCSFWQNECVRSSFGWRRQECFGKPGMVIIFDKEKIVCLANAFNEYEKLLTFNHSPHIYVDINWEAWRCDKWSWRNIYNFTCRKKDKRIWWWLQQWYHSWEKCTERLPRSCQWKNHGWYSKSIGKLFGYVLLCFIFLGKT